MLDFVTGTIAGVRSRLGHASDIATVRAYPDNGGARPNEADVLPAHSCYVCGGTVEDGLARLGSTVCHDCRHGSAHRPAQARV